MNQEIRTFGADLTRSNKNISWNAFGVRGRLPGIHPLRVPAELLDFGPATRTSATSMKIIGHRGSAGPHPENTLPAFREAWASAADGIEADVRLTRDLRLAVIHDRTLERTFGIPASVADSSLQALQDATRDHPAGPLPSLDEVLAEAPPAKFCLIELKVDSADASFTPEDYANALTRAVSAGPVPREHIRLISFDPFLLLSLRDLLTDLRLLWLPLPLLGATALETFWRVTALNRLDGIGHSRIIQPLPADFADDLRESGKERSVWTVNDLEEAQVYQENNYDFLTTDFPAEFVRALNVD